MTIFRTVMTEMQYEEIACQGSAETATRDRRQHGSSWRRVAAPWPKTDGTPMPDPIAATTSDVNFPTKQTLGGCGTTFGAANRKALGFDH